jgi:hypothetical protein
VQEKQLGYLPMKLKLNDAVITLPVL